MEFTLDFDFQSGGHVSFNFLLQFNASSRSSSIITAAELTLFVCLVLADVGVTVNENAISAIFEIERLNTEAELVLSDDLVVPGVRWVFWATTFVWSKRKVDIFIINGYILTKSYFIPQKSHKIQRI